MNSPVFTLHGIIATVFGLGRAVKKAPGTAGSAAAAVAALWLPPQIRIALIVILFFVGAWASGAYEKTLGCTDPGEVIIDEVVGQLIATLGHVSGAGLAASAAGVSEFVVPAFLMFRFFDILKPWPISACEKLPGGWGIMLDDVAGGVIANLMLWALRKIFIDGWLPF